jgi:hypothetical protein
VNPARNAADLDHESIRFELDEQIVHGLRSGLERLEHGLCALGVVETGHALELPDVNGENPCHHWVSLSSGFIG